MPGPAGRLRRSNRLRRTGEYRRVAREGRRAAGSGLVVLAAQQKGTRGAVSPRLGVTVSRRVGNAVARNTLKRRIREWFRSARGVIPPELDVVVIAQPGSTALSSAELHGALDRLATAVGRGDAR